MLIKSEKDSVDFVDVGSSDDEGGEVAPQNSFPAPPQPTIHPPPINESRCFWKAGSYNIVSNPARVAAGQLEHARVHPKFLHSNATSHKWAFGAIAELLDNSVDEICNGATYVKVDRIYNTRDHSPALLIQDDGGGMDPECLRQCMSLGYSSKKTNTTIGQYGNGFKTSTMRLGADVLVFSRKICGRRVMQSIGLLSYTFLRRTGQDDIVVPMVDFEIIDGRAQPLIYSSQDDWISNFKVMLEWSPFSSKEELMQQFEDIGSHGTKVVIYNLWLNDDGIFELDFDDDEEDIRLRDEAKFGNFQKSSKDERTESHISYLMRYSLRAYASILYLRKFSNFQIILRGKPVEQHNIVDELRFPKVATYRPQLGIASKEVIVEITTGFIQEAPDLKVSGFNVYHKNRLIMPFWKVIHEGSMRGRGVVGVLEANFIEPAHDKQDFERTALFIRLETRLKQMMLDYWKNHCHLIGIQSASADIQNLKKKFPGSQPIVGSVANMQKRMTVDQPVGQATNFQPIIGLATIGCNGQRQADVVSAQLLLEEGYHDSISNEVSPAEDPIQQALAATTELQEGSAEEPASMDISWSPSIEKLCEEKVQLFVRCEEHRRNAVDLKQTIASLESELAEARKKCSQLASQLEARRKQKTV